MEEFRQSVQETIDSESCKSSNSKLLVRCFMNYYLLLISASSYLPGLIFSNLSMKTIGNIHGYLSDFIFGSMLFPMAIFVFRKKVIVDNSSLVVVLLDKYIYRYSNKIFWIGITFSLILMLISGNLFFVPILIAVIIFYKICYKTSAFIIKVINNPKNR